LLRGGEWGGYKPSKQYGGIGVGGLRNRSALAIGGRIGDVGRIYDAKGGEGKRIVRK